ncbi:hypothetical protein TNCV_1692571 [Trichonephila clavipes]|nr:hypothetical protein TNCV_1692571 [Trichonephila clavipes]
MTRRRVENREGSLGYPRFVIPVFTKYSKPLRKRKRSLGYLGLGHPYSPKEAVGSLMVRASDSRPEGLGSMPDATKYPPSMYGIRSR